jgi:hypothetical protein
LLRPTVRSLKAIGTSITRAPARTARQAQSTWKQYPWLATSSKGSLPIRSIRAARKPPVASASGSRSAHRV